MEQMVNYIKSELNIELKIIDQKDCYVVKTYAKKKVYQLIKHFYYKYIFPNFSRIITSLL